MEPDDLIDSDTESVCSTTSASSFSSERRTAVFAKFSPSITTDQLYDHFADNGFDKTKVDIHRRTDRATGKPSANAMVLTTSPEEEIISQLNGTVIMGKYTLTVEPFRRLSKKPIRKSVSALSAMSGTSPEIVGSDCKGIALSAESESCRVFVGARLPEDVTEQHIRKHFREFSHAISKVDCIRDKRTNASKGYFFVMFRTEAYANMAIRSLNQSLLLGKYKLKVELQKSYPNSSTMPSLHKVIVDDLDPRISNDEIKALIGVPVVKLGSLEPNAHQRYLQFQNQHDAYIAIQNLNGKNLFGKTVHAYSQNECMQRPSKIHYRNQGSFQHPVSPPLFQRSDSQPLLHGRKFDSYPQAIPLLHPVSPVFPPLQSGATGFLENCNSNTCPHSSTQPNLSQDPTLGCASLDQNLCYPVKITRLPMSVSDEALNALFSQAGEILGRPIFHSSEQPYAHVNFKHKSGAQSAVQRFNGTIFCGREIRVSAQKPKALSQSTETTSNISLDHPSNEEVPAKLIEPKRYCIILYDAC
jgi:RNA recognition motif-containing protein